MKMSFKERILRFFAGRNGPDALSNLVFWIAIIPALAAMFIPNPWIGGGLYLLALVLIGYAFFRIFSRNLWKRQKENAALVRWWSFRKTRFAQRKTHRFFRCPRCKAWLRVPKHKGKILVTCRPCGHKFEKKT